jgi:hypothetical protein
MDGRYCTCRRSIYLIDLDSTESLMGSILAPYHDARRRAGGVTHPRRPDAKGGNGNYPVIQAL